MEVGERRVVFVRGVYAAAVGRIKLDINASALAVIKQTDIGGVFFLDVEHRRIDNGQRDFGGCGTAQIICGGDMERADITGLVFGFVARDGQVQELAGRRDKHFLLPAVELVVAHGGSAEREIGNVGADNRDINRLCPARHMDQRPGQNLAAGLRRQQHPGIGLVADNQKVRGFALLVSGLVGEDRDAAGMELARVELIPGNPDGSRRDNVLAELVFGPELDSVRAVAVRLPSRERFAVGIRG